MVSKQQGKSIIEGIVKRYFSVEKNPQILKDRLLSEQDISTKFVLPMLEALNWDPLKIAIDDRSIGPEVHEKGFRERDSKESVRQKVKRGLPDFSLRGPYSKVPFFVEVKHPNQGKLNPERDLRKYEDGHIVLLTSFRESLLVVIGKESKKYPYRKFIATSPGLYVDEFDNLWKYVSNTKEAEGTRMGMKAWRPGQRDASD